MAKKAAAVKTTRINRDTPVPAAALERYCRGLNDWPRSWMGLEKDVTAGEKRQLRATTAVLRFHLPQVPPLLGAVRALTGAAERNGKLASKENWLRKENAKTPVSGFNLTPSDAKLLPTDSPDEAEMITPTSDDRFPHA